MNVKVNIAIAQLKFKVGDINFNLKVIIDAINRAEQLNIDLIVFPELAISGYHPQDLLFYNEFVTSINNAVATLLTLNKNQSLTIVIGTPWQDESELYNAVLVIEKGKVIHLQYKHHLPNYNCFDEQRYCIAGLLPEPVDWRGTKLGILIGEDLWFDNPANILAAQGAKLLLALNASPFHHGKLDERLSVALAQNAATGLPLVYVNGCYVSDDFFFDGGSFIINSHGQVVSLLPRFKETLVTSEFAISEFDFNPINDHAINVKSDVNEDIASAIILALSQTIDNSRKNKVLTCLDGSESSQISTIMAVDALGADAIIAVIFKDLMPKVKYDEQVKMAKRLGIKLYSKAIKTHIASTKELCAIHQDQPKTQQQKSGRNLVLTTLASQVIGTVMSQLAAELEAIIIDHTCKTHIALGHGIAVSPDSYNVVKDLWFGELMAYASWRNGTLPRGAKSVKIDLIPAKHLNSAMTAHYDLGNNKVPLAQLDEILKLIHYKNLSVPDIVKQGYDQNVVEQIKDQYLNSGNARRIAAKGIRLSQRDFARDTRLPVKI